MELLPNFPFRKMQSVLAAWLAGNAALNSSKISGGGISLRNSDFKYTVGKIVRPDAFDPNPLVECSSGIHFFITKEEAEEYTG